MFEIKNTLSFNTDKLVEGSDFDYITRTSLNQGILRETGFVNSENINESGCWSLGLLQMDFFYRKKHWYAGQFVRKVIPKFQLTENIILYFSTLLNKQKSKLLPVLIRNIDTTFLSLLIQLPITSTGEIDFAFMENFINALEDECICELEEERISELNAYLEVTGLKDYTLTPEEENALKDFSSLTWEDFNVVDLFRVKNTHNILSSEIVENSGEVPYLCASAENNAVSSYIKYNEDFLDEGNCIFIGGKTFVVSYQENDFFSNDSHNLALYHKKAELRNLKNQLFLSTCIKRSLQHLYSWGDSISNKKIQKDVIKLPIKNNSPNYPFMEIFISAIQKLVIKDVVLYADKKINAAKSITTKP